MSFVVLSWWSLYGFVSATASGLSPPLIILLFSLFFFRFLFLFCFLVFHSYYFSFVAFRSE